MRLFHVSEENNITEFYPRIPTREDMDKSKGLVWAIDERHLPNFLTPRSCPRVAYQIGEHTLLEDKEKFFSSKTQSYVVIIERSWFEIMRQTVLYLYEFNAEGFYLQDKTAGYYVSETKQIPISQRKIEDLFSELLSRNVEIRIVDYLWDIAAQVSNSTLEWSLCKMANASQKPMQY